MNTWPNYRQPLVTECWFHTRHALRPGLCSEDAARALLGHDAFTNAEVDGWVRPVRAAKVAIEAEKEAHIYMDPTLRRDRAAYFRFVKDALERGSSACSGRLFAISVCSL